MRTKDQVIAELSKILEIDDEAANKIYALLPDILSLHKNNAELTTKEDYLKDKAPAEEAPEKEDETTEEEKPTLILKPVQPIAPAAADTEPAEEEAVEEIADEPIKPLLITKIIRPEEDIPEESAIETEETKEENKLEIKKPALVLTPVEPVAATEDESAQEEPVVEEVFEDTPDEEPVEEEAPEIQEEPVEEAMLTEEAPAEAEAEGLIIFDCECCGDSIEAPESFANTEAECPFCGTVVIVPAESQAAEEPIAIEEPEIEPAPIALEPVAEPITLTPTPVDTLPPAPVAQPVITFEEPAAPPAPAVATAPQNKPIFNQNELDKTIRIEIPEDMLNPQEEAGKKTVFIKRRRS